MHSVGYQWFNCDSNSIMNGENNQSFTPKFNGSYAVILTKNGCVDTSDCKYVSVVGIEPIVSNNFSVFPNPTEGIVNISFEKSIQGVVSIFDIQGMEVFSLIFSQNKTLSVNLPENLDEGLYFIQVSSTEGVYRKQMVLKR